ncbi:hypothetical protein C9374_004627 [Naegleria lovaniensis]|uniref:Uncharacterized protein n=1 Tax=Naegleria lovaniensis TaxID=51637 RepID=A0AA88GMX8_NAELO|nr:uncharacterized protein C9374_004627 [Naegleria lovaniensis]KAG2383290.1 hypothetical protein C9374_004627 [Naegleria lovaniensis]
MIESMNDTFITNNTTTSMSGPCHPLLLNLGSLSMEPFNATISNGLCPETVFSVSLSSFELFIFTILAPLSVLGLIWMRKSRHLQARGLFTLIWTTLSCAFGIVFPTLRWAIGRKIFPCGLYILIIFNIPQVISLPCICKCLALYAKFKLYRLLDEKKQLSNCEISSDVVDTVSTNTTTAAFQVDVTQNNKIPRAQSLDIVQTPKSQCDHTPTVTFQSPSTTRNPKILQRSMN